MRENPESSTAVAHERELDQIEAEWRDELLEARAQIDELKDVLRGLSAHFRLWKYAMKSLRSLWTEWGNFKMLKTLRTTVSKRR
jgi:hypothetical protein